MLVSTILIVIALVGIVFLSYSFVKLGQNHAKDADVLEALGFCDTDSSELFDIAASRILDRYFYLGLIVSSGWTMTEHFTKTQQDRAVLPAPQEASAESSAASRSST